jgi:polyhydroxybutyrate depolymerase
MRVCALALATLLLIAGCTVGRDRGTEPIPDSTSPAVAVGRSTGTLDVGGQQRTYRVYRPASVRAPAPLVLVLHGAAGSGQQAEDSYGWDAQAESGGFLAVFPDGIRRTWNVDPDCCGAAAAQNVDDVGFLTALVASFAPLVDQTRIYATGISNGAMMSYRLACDTEIFAAIASVSGTMINQCPDPAPLSVLAIHGTADRTIPYDGGPGRRHNQGAGARLPAKIDGPPIPSLMDTWRTVNGCPAPQSTTVGPVTTSTVTCPDNRAVELITINGAGHQWPGGREAPLARQLLDLDAPSTALQATPTIWTFFAAHPRAGA